MSIKVVGEKEILAILKGLEAKIAKKLLRTSLRKVLKPMATDIKAAAPVGDEPLTEGDKPHGQIKKYTKVAAGRRKKNYVGMVIKVDNKNRETNPYWSAFTEKGTKNIRAQHWMKDVFDKDAPAARDQLIKEIKQAIEDSVKKS